MQQNEQSQDSLVMSTSQQCARLHVRECSPHAWPPQVGELVILLTSPESKTRGFVGVKTSPQTVRFLDSCDDKDVQVTDEQLISTGMKGEDLCGQYVVSPVELSKSLTTERSFPDFERYKSTKKSSPKAKPKTLAQQLKALTPEQNKLLAAMLLQKLSEAKKETQK